MTLDTSLIILGLVLIGLISTSVLFFRIRRSDKTLIETQRRQIQELEHRIDLFEHHFDTLVVRKTEEGTRKIKNLHSAAEDLKMTIQKMEQTFKKGHQDIQPLLKNLRHIATLSTFLEEMLTKPTTPDSLTEMRRINREINGTFQDLIHKFDAFIEESLPVKLAPGKPQKKEALQTTPLKILIIEDDPFTAKSVSEKLRAAKYQTTEARDAESGLEIAKFMHPDLILLDVELPGMNGIEALKHLKGLPETEDIPVLIISGYALSQDMNKAIELGCDGYLTKPFTADFLHIIGRTIQQGKKGSS